MRKVRVGMVGGGRGAFIGQIHRMALALDGQGELVCGAFSKDESRSKGSGLELGLSPSRCYARFQDMLEAEARLAHAPSRPAPHARHA